MGENSKIEWCDHTFNPWIGCQKVSPGCDHCYAEALMDLRYGRVQWGPHGDRQRTSEQNWKKPIQWNAQAREFRKEHGHRPRVFCASLADVFDNQVHSSLAQGFVRFNPRMQEIGLVSSDQETRKYRKNAAVRLGRWVLQRLARSNGRRSKMVRSSVEASKENTCGYSLYFLRACSWARAFAAKRALAGLVDIWRRKRRGRPSTKAAMGSRCYRRLSPLWCCAIS